MNSEENPKRPVDQASWRSAGLGIGFGAVMMLIGACLLLVPVRTATAAARDFAAADTCAPGLRPRQEAQCVSSVPATVERSWKPGVRYTVEDIEVVRGDGKKQRLRMQWHSAEPIVADGAEVRLVRWRGQVRNITYGPGFAHTAYTVENPYTAYAVPFGWGLGLLIIGPALVWVGCRQRWLSGRSRRAAPWQLVVPSLALTVLGVGVAVIAMTLDLRIEETLRWSGAAAALTVLCAGAVCLYKGLRGEQDTIEMAPRRDEREHVFGAVLLGDRSGPAGTRRNAYLVVAPGVVAFTNDPTGAFRREPLPAGLMLERVRPLLASDPDAMDVAAEETSYVVAQCRDGEREVLIAARRRDMPWLVGALPQVRPAGVS
ncbi:hypothetical protein AB0B01_23065 [Streptomyces sp. NPDC044571]|uniref:hypothetical protein n=1 Tax=Streptomyces sp. NPDC044571 TaxID=3155371 RepID=UPI0033D2ACC1